jgi:cell division protein FtsZ
MVFELASEELEVSQTAKLKVIGVGGAGGNAVNRMISAGLCGIDFIVVNTDYQVLQRNLAPSKLRIGCKLTKGLGAGGDPEVGKKATEEDKDKVAEILTGTDMLFITAGMGGGTGTGSAPVIAKIAKEMGILTVAVVTKPFSFEGRRRNENADKGLEDLKSVVDTLIVIPNEKLLHLVSRETPIDSAFARADEVLLNATQGISELITQSGLINVDFADVRSVLKGSGGDALMGTGISKGEGRALEAAKKAISSPLMEDLSITGAKGVLINIHGDSALSLAEVYDAASLISEQAGPESSIFFGAVVDSELNDEVKVTVIASGFQKKQKQPKATIPQTFTERMVKAMDMFEPPTQQQPQQVAQPARRIAVETRQPVHDEYYETVGVQNAPQFISNAEPETLVAPATVQNIPMAASNQKRSGKTLETAAETSAGVCDFSLDVYDTHTFMRRKRG